MFRKLILALVLFVCFTTIFTYLGSLWKGAFKSPLSPNMLSTGPKEKPLDKYSYVNLRSRKYEKSPIMVGDMIKEGKDFVSRGFYFLSDGKKVTGLINLPKSATSRKLPVVIMFRGYIDKETYKTGDGTRHAGEYFASHGFITLAPDFLGYGGSDEPNIDPLRSRFETYVTAINLLSSISSLPEADLDHLFIWGHSNGGQIALTALEIIGANYPTVLWAPVSKPFPFSVLFYSDEASDSGKALRGVVAGFDRDYEAEQYSLTSYLDWILAPVQIQQGTADDIVLPRWSRELSKKLKDLGKTVKYSEYAGGDHNFSGGVWDRAVADDLAFYNSFL